MQLLLQGACSRPANGPSEWMGWHTGCGQEMLVVQVNVTAEDFTQVSILYTCFYSIPCSLYIWEGV